MTFLLRLCVSRDRHPDKFWQRFGSKLCVEERELIMDKVKECFQRVNALKD